MMEKKNIWKNTIVCVIALILCNVMWGGGYLVQKIGLESAALSPEALLFSREFIATICIAVIFRKRIRSAYQKGDWKGGAIGAGFFVAGTMFQTYGLTNTSPGVAAFLTTTYVVIVPLLWWLIKKEKPSKIILLCSILAIVGIGLLSLTDGFKMRPADILVLVCALMFSGYIMSVSVFARNVDEIVFAFLLFLFCSIYSFILFLANDGNWKQFLSLPAILTVLYLALFFTFISNTLQVYAQAYLRPGLAAILLSLESLFGALFGIIGGFDTLTIRFIAGGILMTIAVILPAVEDYRKEKLELAAKETDKLETSSGSKV